VTDYYIFNTPYVLLNPSTPGGSANLPHNSGAALPLFTGINRLMKSFENLFNELKSKAERMDPQSGTVHQLEKGIHAIGKKVVEEACEAWMAAEHEGRERTAVEISQLLYHVQVLMIACDLELEDIYRHL
jgi:phosphoribosyl-ATP pyrophosphohydrolase